MPGFLSKVHFQTGIVVISIRCVIKCIVRVFFGRSNTAGFQVSRYRLLFDGLNVVISWFHKSIEWNDERGGERWKENERALTEVGKVESVCPSVDKKRFLHFSLSLYIYSYSERRRVNCFILLPMAFSFHCSHCLFFLDFEFSPENGFWNQVREPRMRRQALRVCCFRVLYNAPKKRRKKSGDQDKNTWKMSRTKRSRPQATASDCTPLHPFASGEKRVTISSRRKPFHTLSRPQVRT